MFLNRHMRRRAAALGRKSVAICNRNMRPQRSSIVASSVAAGALMLAAPSVAFAQVVPPSANCVISGNTVTCTGDVSDGIDIDDPYDTLNVNNLTQAIEPGVGIDGIYFYRDSGDITINVDTGTYGINASGLGADGIQARLSGDGDITITNNGPIATDRAEGIFAKVLGNGNIAITNTGDIDSVYEGLYAELDGNGNVTINNYGKITSEEQEGIYADVAGNGNIDIFNIAEIASRLESIRAQLSENGDIEINNYGKITSEEQEGIYAKIQGDGDITIENHAGIQSYNGQGIYAHVDSYGDITITNTGEIESLETGIYAKIGYDGVITINNDGKITSEDEEGIYAKIDGDGVITITNVGDIDSGLGGIFARVGETDDLGDSEGSIFITNHGKIDSVNDGIYAEISRDGDIEINNYGRIEAEKHGIYSQVDNNGDITIYNQGFIGSVNDGIYAQIENNGNITITNLGDIISGAEGIHAYVEYNGIITITNYGDINSVDDGIYAYVENDGNITITNDGIIESSDEDGIFAKILFDGDITIENHKRIDANSGYGIFAAVKDNGNITIINAGDIESYDDGIYAEVNDDGDITITNDGIIESLDGKGIYAYVNGNGKIEITNYGPITSQDDQGIDAHIDGEGDITIWQTGDITAAKDAIDLGVQEGSTATVNIMSGVLRGGTEDGDGAAIDFDGPPGSNNILNIFGNVTLSSVDGKAIDSNYEEDDDEDEDERGNGNTTVNNWGILNTVTEGDITLGDGENAFNNNVGAIFNSGSVVDLGLGNLFTNHGTISPGSDGNVFQTNLTGQFKQTYTGVLLTDVDLTTGTADRLDISETAILTGNVKVNILNPSYGAQENIILSAEEGTTINGLGLLASPALQAMLTYPNANDVVLSTNLDFAAPGAMLNENQTSLANTIETAFAAGGGALDPVILAVLNGPNNVADYQLALDQLGGESFLNEDKVAQLSTENFASQLFSCQVGGVQYAAVSEGSCVWVRPHGRTVDYDTTSANVGFEDDAFGASVGGQTEFAPDWFAGAGFGYEEGDLTSDIGVTSDRQTLHGGLNLKRTMGAFAVSGAVFGSTSSYDTTRSFVIGSLAATNTSEHNVNVLGARIRGAYAHEFGGGAFVKPMVDFSLTHLTREGFTETGTAATALTIADTSETKFSATPAVEFGLDKQIKDNQMVRFYGKAGVSIEADASYALSASFSNAPAGTAGFVSNTEFDNVFAEVEAGFTFMDSEMGAIQLGFQGRYSENSTQSGGFIKANMDF